MFENYAQASYIVKNSNHSYKKLNQHTESFLKLDDYIYANYNYESLRYRLVSQTNSNKNYEESL